MNKIKIFVFLFIYLTLHTFSQSRVLELKKYSDIALFDTLGTSYQNLVGEWAGEEIQYDPTQSFIKVKFKVIFKLKQSGNRVYGTSYIEDKYRGSYGDMNIRGMVLDNKFYFEEYEINQERFYEKNVVWCLRSGEMDIQVNGDIVSLEGLHYNGYASDTYRLCTDYVKMRVTKTFDSALKSNASSSIPVVIRGNYSGSMKMLIYPNPCREQTGISYEVPHASKVKIDIFNLSGKYLETVVDDQYQEGSQHLQFSLSNYAPGVYLVRIQAGTLQGAGQVVKEN